MYSRRMLLLENVLALISGQVECRRLFNYVIKAVPTFFQIHSWPTSRALISLQEFFNGLKGLPCPQHGRVLDKQLPSKRWACSSVPRQAESSLSFCLTSCEAGRGRVFILAVKTGTTTCLPKDLGPCTKAQIIGKRCGVIHIEMCSSAHIESEWLTTTCFYTQ